MIVVENKDFGGAVWRDYLRTVVDYVHLNPGRAGLVDGVERPTASYPWSSMADGFLVPPSKRPSWLAVNEVLNLFDQKDTPQGRRAFAERLDQWIRAEGNEDTILSQSYEVRVERGWYWGGVEFKEAMLEKFSKPSNRTYRSSDQVKDHSERDALKIIEEAKSHFGLDEQELRQVRRGDSTRAAIAWRIFHDTTVSQEWIAEHLNMKSAPNVCRQIRLFKQLNPSSVGAKLRQWKKRRNF